MFLRKNAAGILLLILLLWMEKSLNPVISKSKVASRGATTVTVTKNEIFESWNQGGKYHLAIVLVGEDDSIDGPHYVTHPFKEEPGWGVSSVNYDLKTLLARAQMLNA
jgi:hypothetical protein